MALVQVCELVADSVRYDVLPAELLGKVHRFLELFVAAFGYEWLTPKLHWMLHYAEALLKNKRLFNCFCLERKHKVPKRYAEDYKRIMRSSSQSILSDRWIREVFFSIVSFLDGPESASSACRHFRAGSNLLQPP